MIGPVILSEGSEASEVEESHDISNIHEILRLASLAQDDWMDEEGDARLLQTEREE